MYGLVFFTQEVNCERKVVKLLEFETHPTVVARLRSRPKPLCRHATETPYDFVIKNFSLTYAQIHKFTYSHHGRKCHGSIGHFTISLNCSSSGEECLYNIFNTKLKKKQEFRAQVYICFRFSKLNTE